MKKLALITALSAITINAFAVDLKTEDQKIAYTIGSQIGESLKMVSDNITLDQAVLFDAISATLAGKEPQLSQADMDKAMQSLQSKMAEKMQAKIKEEGKANQAEGEKFLADNKAKDGVKVTASGLQYRVVKAGDGKKPVATDTVKVNYKGFLPDGTKFDDSADAGGAVEFPLNAVITGWTEGLQLMPVGSTYEFVIPAELAYGEMAPPSIGPNRVLRFEVELVDIPSAKTAENKTTDQSAKNTAEKTVEKVEKATEKATEKTAVDSVKEQAKTAVKDKVDAVKEDVKTAVSETAEKVTNKATDAVKETAKDAVKKVAE